MKTLGIDVGSSSVKVSLLDVATGECAGAVTLPSAEMPIDAPQPGWAEQDPRMWWNYVREGVRTLVARAGGAGAVKAIGITYQMHGLVCLDEAASRCENPLFGATAGLWRSGIERSTRSDTIAVWNAC